MNVKKIRWLIVILITSLYLILAIDIRPKAYEQNWNSIIQLTLGCLPNFLAVIGLTNLMQIFSKQNEIYKPILQTGLVVLIYEITGGFGRKSGIGITFDYFDILTTILGVLITILIERKLTIKTEFSEN